MNEQADFLLIELEEKMEKSIEATKAEFATIRTGRANPALLDQITIEYYGVETPIKQISSISVPEGNQLYIKPFDKSVLKKIEYAIGTSPIGLTPQNDGIGIRLVLPVLTEERRRTLCKDVERFVEAGKVAVRNIRREGNELIKKLDLPEDSEHGYIEDVQTLTNRYTEKMEEIGKKKTEEIMVI
ncbi:MAG: ribosome recycling factor [Acholeplasmataceae bacterium]|jgi:ribosome recycling factor|nr:ribosome recycling factor [Acholeplasmataceae bacterium]MDD4204418.1 ribosome recycling factor [Acholeplasmataceae bacterium]MDD4823635.1 ribosome recycling factor [Acholeplasmataceae bacterium]